MHTHRWTSTYRHTQPHIHMHTCTHTQTHHHLHHHSQPLHIHYMYMYHHISLHVHTTTTATAAATATRTHTHTHQSHTTYRTLHKITTTYKKKHHHRHHHTGQVANQVLICMCTLYLYAWLVEEKHHQCKLHWVAAGWMQVTLDNALAKFTYEQYATIN